MSDYLGEVLDNRYRVECLIGKGGMGLVYLGTHQLIGRKVAIKFLREEYSKNEQVVTRFYREAQAAAAIGNKHIIDVLDVGISDRNEPYLVMEYLEGECLATMLKRTGPIELGAACAILEPVLQALHSAHAKGIIHRDLKPENIFLVHDEDDDSVFIKLIDFGISKIIETGDQSKLTQAGATMGTPAYMAPEQAKGELDVDHRADLHAVGVILYQMLTGETPFVADNNIKLLVDIISGEPRSPRSVYPDFPLDAEPVVEKALQKAPEDRYQSASEMLEAIRMLTSDTERHTRLTEFASGMGERVGAVGDLGADMESTDGDSVPLKVLSRVAGARGTPGTPGEWTGTSQKMTGGPPIAKKSSPVVAVVIVVLVLGGAAAAGVLWKIKTDGARQTSPHTVSGVNPASIEATDDKDGASGRDSAQSSKPPRPSSDIASGPSEKSVKITVVGAPIGAVIRYNGARASSNPFYLKKGDREGTLEVEAPGMPPFESALIPSEDREVSVLPETDDETQTAEKETRKNKDDRSRRGTSKSRHKDENKREDKEKEKVTIKKGKRGTLIAEDFE